VITLFCRTADLVVDAAKLPGPLRVVEERSEVKAVVIRTVVFSMIRGCYCCHLMSVD